MEAEQTIEVERHAREVLVGIGDLALDSTLRIVRYFARIAELKVDALLQEAGSVTAPIPKQPWNRRRDRRVGSMGIMIIGMSNATREHRCKNGECKLPLVASHVESPH